MSVAGSQDLRTLVSEGRNPRSTEIDLLPTEDIVALMNAEDAGVAEAIRAELPAIARAVDRIAGPSAKAGG